MIMKCVSGRRRERASRDICGNRSIFKHSLTIIDRLRDAGVTLSCHINDLLDVHTSLATALLPPNRTGALRVLELGTGCGIVGIAIAQVISNSQVLLTDLAEAREIVDRNLRQAKLAKGSTIAFQELDWVDDSSASLQSSYDLVLAADCTYNPDSRYVPDSFLRNSTLISNCFTVRHSLIP